MTVGVRDFQWWMDHQLGLHPRGIDLGLDRVREVAERLLDGRPAKSVITVAGTNGKGSTVAYLEALAIAHGISVACYTSPHLFRYGERLRINGVESTETDWLPAFEAVETARSEVSLSFFEFGTLAVLWLMQRQNLDLAVLEVGLGGRLDAVNIIDCDVAIITSIGLDHQDYLGDSIEQIAVEKAGIIRAGKPVVIAAREGRETLVDCAQRLSAPSYLLHRDFGFTEGPRNNNFLHSHASELRSRRYASWQGSGHSLRSAPCGRSLGTPSVKRTYSCANLKEPSGYQWKADVLADVPITASDTRSDANAPHTQDLEGLVIAELAMDSPCQWDNAAAALAAWLILRLASERGAAARALSAVRVAGRLQQINERPRVVMDVAHNAAASRELNRWLQQQETPGAVRAVFGALHDKDSVSMLQSLIASVNYWYGGGLGAEESRGMNGEDLRMRHEAVLAKTNCVWAESVQDALRRALADADSDDLIIVFGSFAVVRTVVDFFDDRRSSL